MSESSCGLVCMSGSSFGADSLPDISFDWCCNSQQLWDFFLCQLAGMGLFPHLVAAVGLFSCLAAAVGLVLCMAAAVGLTMRLLVAIGLFRCLGAAMRLFLGLIAAVGLLWREEGEGREQERFFLCKIAENNQSCII